jgi:hypothetical protein
MMRKNWILPDLRMTQILFTALRMYSSIHPVECRVRTFTDAGFYFDFEDTDFTSPLFG